MRVVLTVQNDRSATAGMGPGMKGDTVFGVPLHPGAHEREGDTEYGVPLAFSSTVVLCNFC